jgi:subtilisin family serine protease
MNKIISVLLFILTLNSSFAKDKYWISFKDKNVNKYQYEEYLSETALQNRTRFGLPLFQYSDIPVNSDFISSINSRGIQTLYASRWLNAVSAYMTKEQAEEIKKLDFVSEVNPIDGRLIITSCGVMVNPAYVHIAMKQMQINSFIDDSLSGKGVVIGVIDAGFYEAQTDKKLKHLFDEKRIVGQRDFLAPEREDLITVKATDADYHGRMVLDMIAGYNVATRELTGMATNSTFYLARTEHGDREFRGEEDTWIAAVEWMDSKGVRLISTSLGYAIKMDDPNDNYTQEQMNGKTARITKAAQIATDEKGIFLVVSAGNEGSNPSWQIVSAPADAQGVLSIGATKSESCERIEYSSIGPEFLPYLKPNVSCYSPNGTSFSAPAVAGFVSCLMQRAPNLNNKKIKEIIEKSAHLYPYGNNFIGYGIPKASRALRLIENPSVKFGTDSQKEVSGKSTTLKIDKRKKQEAVIFHKKNEFVVVEQQTVAFKNGKLKIRKPPHISRTTVSYNDTVVEVIWK